MVLKNIILKLIKKSDFRPSALAHLKRQTAAQEKFKFPTNIELLLVYHKLLKAKSIAKNPTLENLLRTRAVRTLSGVAIITVLTKPYKCPGKCLYCPSEKGMPKSYLKNEPAAQRAYLTKFDPYLQVKTRLNALAMTGHATDKIELIVLGGTWSVYPKNYQYWFISECFRAANKKNAVIATSPWRGKQSRTITVVHSPRLSFGEAGGIAASSRYAELLAMTLKTEQKKNETAKHKIVGLTLETRPDYINIKEIKNMRELGCTRVELGAQSVYDDVLKTNRRGHNATTIANATTLLKNAGFKINYHIMLNLPGSSLARDEKMFDTLFLNPDFKPDLLKIYPCVVLRSAPLYNLWKNKKYKPYNQKQLVLLLLKIKQKIPYYVRVQRIIRDIPNQYIIAGCDVPNLRQLIDNSGQKKCVCIRCREIRGQHSPKDKIKFFRFDYEASGGKEIFLSFESPNRKKLYALLRLRIPDNSKNTSFIILKNAALIRELHTYGKLIPLNTNRLPATATQHKGLGKKLMTEAEKIIKKETNLKSIAVIAGVGVRNYYRKLGYCLKDEYMIKSI